MTDAEPKKPLMGDLGGYLMPPEISSWLIRFFEERETQDEICRKGIPDGAEPRGILDGGN